MRLQIAQVIVQTIKRFRNYDFVIMSGIEKITFECLKKTF